MILMHESTCSTLMNYKKWGFYHPSNTSNSRGVSIFVCRLHVLINYLFLPALKLQTVYKFLICKAIWVS